MNSSLLDPWRLLRCPACTTKLTLDGEAFACPGCTRSFPFVDGLPRLYHPHDQGVGDVTESIRSFYEEHPFPSYERLDDVASLVSRARHNPFTRLLDEQIPFGSTVLEVGCGTGQLSACLSLAQRKVYGTDLCLNSLKMGLTFKRKYHLDRVHFLQMNLFRPCFSPGTFDLVICNGVLHHTSDPRGGFESIARLVRPGGFLMIGLYHRFGRLFTDLRRFIFRIAGNGAYFLDPRLSDTDLDEARKDVWFHDQYLNPHESRHEISQVQEWFRACDIEMVRSIPIGRLLEPFSERALLFDKPVPVSPLELWIKERGLAFTGSAEGGFFMMIGRRPPQEQREP